MYILQYIQLYEWKLLNCCTTNTDWESPNRTNERKKKYRIHWSYSNKKKTEKIKSNEKTTSISLMHYPHRARERERENRRASSLSLFTIRTRCLLCIWLFRFLLASLLHFFDSPFLRLLCDSIINFFIACICIGSFVQIHTHRHTHTCNVQPSAFPFSMLYATLIDIIKLDFWVLRRFFLFFASLILHT